MLRTHSDTRLAGTNLTKQLSHKKCPGERHAEQSTSGIRACLGQMTCHTSAAGMRRLFAHRPDGNVTCRGPAGTFQAIAARTVPQPDTSVAVCTCMEQFLAPHLRHLCASPRSLPHVRRLTTECVSSRWSTSQPMLRGICSRQTAGLASPWQEKNIVVAANMLPTCKQSGRVISVAPPAMWVGPAAPAGPAHTASCRRLRRSPQPCQAPACGQQATLSGLPQGTHKG
jgi:hypothetical protein